MKSIHRCYHTLLLLPLMGSPSVLGFQVSNSFSRAPRVSSTSSSSSSTILFHNNAESSSSSGTYPPEFHRAVQCAKNQGLCNVDELLSLADELEQYDDSCFLTTWEVPMMDDDDCEAEVLDRLDIADLLRTEGEMQQRRQNMEFNSFKEQIEKDEERATTKSSPPPPKDVIDLYDNYYQCVYSKTSLGP